MDTCEYNIWLPHSMMTMFEIIMTIISSSINIITTMLTSIMYGHRAGYGQFSSKFA